ncbi:TetR/AcrR family transcriptional regulator [Nocardia sp. NPDC127526]|uniref:TetR/AcrR family transcriptional regulator n=1 Tax=Nocardia sp. NPDC127526 TaxID=3345393 RepID=UPI00362D3C12
MSERRERILDAARGLIVRDGYTSVSMHAIARAAGVTRPALYAEFSDRDELFADLLDREERAVLEMAADSTPELPPGADPVAVADQAVGIFLDLVLSAPETWRLVLMPGDGMPPEAHERIEKARGAIRERTRVLLTVAAALGEREIDTELVSHGAISVSETAARLLVQDGADREAVAKTLRWLTRRALAAAAIPVRPAGKD